MSWSIAIFAQAEVSLEEFAQQLEELWGVHLELQAGQGERVYWYGCDNVVTYVGVHTLVNDRGLDFESYRYDITLWPRNHHLQEVRQRWRDECAPTLFNSLKATQRYDLLMVEEVQFKLMEYHPPDRLSIRTA